MEHHLVGGGWSRAAARAVYGDFLEAAGRTPTVACVVLRERHQRRGAVHGELDRVGAALRSVAPCTPVPVTVAEGSVLDPAELGDADALFVCGGPTPAYAAALRPVAAALRDWLGEGRPYAGFSAGAAVAAEQALVGGWLADGRPVCPQGAAEDLDEVSVGSGLGLVPFAVDVHGAQWGTLSRAVSAVSQGQVPVAVCIDEDTAVLTEGRRLRVVGAGRAHLVRPSDAGAQVSVLRTGMSTSLG